MGYSDLFCLSKDDLLEALTEYPEAKDQLMEIGQQMLRKDNLLDEEALRRAQETKESFDEKIQRLDSTLETMGTKLARLIGEYGASQAKLKRRLARLESAGHQPNQLEKSLDTTKFAASDEEEQ